MKTSVYPRKANFKQLGELAGATLWENSLRNNHASKETTITSEGQTTHCKGSAQQEKVGQVLHGLKPLKMIQSNYKL